MQTKSQACYEVTLRALKRAAPGFNPEKAMVDFELGQASAWEVVFPNIELSGCLFHSSKVCNFIWFVIICLVYTKP